MSINIDILLYIENVIQLKSLIISKDIILN